MTGPASVALLILVGILGLFVGSYLNVVICRVPTGAPLTQSSQCLNCGAPIAARHNIPVVSWVALRGRCASCAERISVRYPIIELASAAAFIAIVVWGLSAPMPESTAWSAVALIVAYLYFAAISIALTVIDLDTHRLPNAIVLPSYLVGGILLAFVSLLSGDWGASLRAFLGMVALYAFYFVLRWVSRTGMGGGDVKLAGVIGMYLAYLGWDAFAIGAFAAFVLGGIFGLGLLIARRAGRKSAIPFGPWMIAGAWTGIFAGEALARGYAGHLLAM